MNDYEQKQEARRERLLERADRKQRESDGSFQRADDAVAGIPPGQPILVGHHSEKRHRRALERSDNAMRKGFALREEAEQLRARAAAVGHGGISADDPSAVEKLREKLDGLVAKQEFMKRVNREYRKGGWDAVTGITDTQRAAFAKAMESDWRANPKPFESYQLSNNGANIRRVKQRIAELEAADAIEDRREAFEGYALVIDTRDNRVRIEFDRKPNKATCRFMRSRGFIFSRRNSAWQRKLNRGAIYAAEQTAQALAEMELY